MMETVSPLILAPSAFLLSLSSSSRNCGRPRKTLSSSFFYLAASPNQSFLGGWQRRLINHHHNDDDCDRDVVVGLARRRKTMVLMTLQRQSAKMRSDRYSSRTLLPSAGNKNSSPSWICRSRVGDSGRVSRSSVAPPFDFLYNNGLLIMRALAFVGTVLVAGFLCLYVQSQTQAYIERYILPPLSSMVGTYLGRKLDLGRVRSVSPFGITLESCSVSPHSEEFSTGQLPTIEIKIRPFTSIRKRQVVLDAVVVQPNILVSQKRDWTWLGIPVPSGKHLRRSSSEEGLDHRTKTRRLAREEMAKHRVDDRDRLARESAKNEYGFSNQHSLVDWMSSSSSEMAKVKGKGKMREWEAMAEDEANGDYGEHLSEVALASDRFSFRRPLQEYKSWLDSHFVRPIRLFQQWSSKGTSDKLQVQRRNLARSAAAANMYFDKIDHGLLDPTPLNRGNTAPLPAATTTYDFGLSGVGLIAGLVSDDNDTMSKKESPFTIANHSSEEGMKSENYSDMPIHEALLEAVQEKENGRGHFVISTGRAKFQGVEEDKTSEEPSFLMKGQLDDAENEKGRETNTEGSPIQKMSSNYNPMQTAGRNGSNYEENGGAVGESSSTFLTGVSVASELVRGKGVGYARGKYTHSHDADFRGVGSAFGNQPHSSYISLNNRARMFTNKLLEQAKKNIKAALVQNWVPVALESVYFKGGTLMLLAYGDSEVRVMENINGYLKFGNNYDQVDVHLIGNLMEWRKSTPSPRDGGNLLVKVYVDVKQQKWRVKLKGSDLYAPLLERLLEIPLDWTDGRANGELNLWASKGDRFPNLAGRLNVSNLGFKIWESPSAFKEVSGTLFFQGQRMFLHNTKGFFGAVPLHVSGDMDLNPESGEYRLVCQVPNVEVNALMKTMRAQPPLHPVAGALKAAVYCRGPLEAPVFAGSAEILKKDVNIALNRPLSSAATEAIQQNESRGAVAAFDRVPFSFASANFTFDTDNCIADLYGLRAALVDGGEIRGAGSMWICPEGEVDSTAVNVDLSGNLLFDGVIKNYVRGMTVFPVQLGSVHGEAKVRGALLRPSFDISWSANDAKGSFTGARGDINISHECIVINSSAWTFDLFSKIETSYPPIAPLYRRRRFEERQPPSPPQIEGLEVDLRLKGFDFLGLAPPLANNPTAALHMKATGKAKFQGHVVKRQQEEHTVSGVAGEMTLSGLKLNQFLVAPHLVGALDVFPGSIKLNATGRTDEHLFLEISGSLKPTSMEQMPVHASVADSSKNLLSFSLERGQLRTSMDYQPGRSAKLEVRNLHLDELELASLRGTVQKAEMQLNFYKHKGHGKISVRRPRFSGVQGESLDLACRWSGDVITIEKSVLEQASSRYELQGEYVLPGPRDHSKTKMNKGDGNWKSAMAGQLGRLITSMGRWRLRLEVPGAEVVEMLPMARLLSRSSDPAVVSRSKELFMQGLHNAGFNSENLKQQIDNIRKGRSSPAFEEGSPETVPLPGLAELKGHWHGTFEASGGGNGDTMADFNFHGEEWEWGTYKTQRVVAVGSYDNSGLHLEKMFIQKDTATLHADGTVFGPKPNLHFAVLNFPIGLVPPLVHAFQSSTFQPVTAPSAWTPLTSIKGILYMEGDLRGSVVKPQCDLQVRLLDGSVGGVDLGRAEVSAAVTSSNRFIFNANFEPAIRSGHVHVKGSLPVAASDLDIPEEDDTQKEIINMKRSRGGYRYKSRIGEHFDDDEKKNVQEMLGDEGWEVNLAESLKGLDWDAMDEGALQVDATVKDGGMLLITALSPYVHWLQGNADLKLQVRGTVDQPEVDGTAVFHRVYMSSPVLPRVLSNFGGTIRVHKNQLCVESLEGRVGRKGRLQVKGKLPLKAHESSATSAECIELKADMLEVRAKNVFSGQVDGHMQCIGSLLEPEVSGMIKLSHGEAYLPQEKGDDNTASMLASGLPGMPAEWQLGHLHNHEVIPPSSSSSVAVAVATLPEHIRDSTAGSEENMEEENEQAKPPIAMRLKGVKLNLGPELRVVYPLILNFSVSGNLELNGLADPHWIKPKGTLMFENGDVNLVATQVRLNRDYPNCAKFEPEQGLDPILDLVLVGADWQLKVQGRARNWQRNLLLTSTRSGEPDGHEAARVFESQLAESLLEGDGQLAFKKLAAATVETLMPKIEGKGEFGQARWRLVSAPQIPNLLSLDPTTDPFKSLANLSFGTEVELQLGKRLQASVVRQVKESEMATQWTLIYQLNNKLRILFSSIPSVDNRLLFEYSATSQN